jgi:hypothetical protein
MTAGHFGFAAIIKSQEPEVPLWALMLSTYLIDIIFIILVAAGVESFAPMDPVHPAYGMTIIYAYYSHSLVGAALVALIAGWIASRAWGRRPGIVIRATVFSHWILDLIVHRPDLPILPGNLGNLPLLGFGLWQLPAVSAAVELALALGGAYLYYQSARKAPASTGKGGGQLGRAPAAVGITGLLLVLLLASDVLGLSLMIAILLMLLLIVLCGWLDARLNWSMAAT